MKKPLAMAGLSLFVLVGAAYPEAPQLHYAAAVMAGSAEVSGPTYRPCRPGPGDDRCIQLYERGVRTAYAEWLRDHAVGGPDARQVEAPPRARHARHLPAPRHAPPRYARAASPAPVRCVDGDRPDHRMHQPRMRHEGHHERRDDARHRNHRDYGGGEVRGM